MLLINSSIVSAYNPYGEIYTYKAYYNDEILELDAAKPLLKIGEPFTIRVEFTVYQKYFVSTKLSELGEGNFVIIEGPTSKIGEYTGQIMEENSTEVFEWEVKATDGWKGGSLPLNFVYQIDELGADGRTLINSEFTAVYPTISTEYYNQPDPAPTQTTNSTPAFTIPLTLTALLLACKRKRSP